MEGCFSYSDGITHEANDQLLEKLTSQLKAHKTIKSSQSSSSYRVHKFDACGGVRISSAIPVALSRAVCIGIQGMQTQQVNSPLEECTKNCLKTFPKYHFLCAKL